ncbi:bifunctional metallophosphatase/5'-nucleotidase [Corticibacter populi]|uniref:Bifunctional metallophosphatase/5'-nucleotidase n=1 Tax=Corticibacter populi TaxID=1550736 RepID=A0A3M6QP45_9BURK|nr:5'-nucleotidase C-terminal domain-containing protein [Corticibacter populi]RMX04843.1 bifunctional metallophosphatase/5'-nucleotidase [Corticibacter populi]RZS33737.1 5'-nucleotidase [Corticibacter populi]
MNMQPRRYPLRVSALALACLLAACGGSDDDSNSPEPAGKALALTILHINDHHSHLDGSSKTLLLDTGAAERSQVQVGSAGFPRVTQAIEELAAQHSNVIKIHAGDALTGTLYFNRVGADGEADAALMNTVCFDSFTLGNHEFDKGDTGLKNFLDLLRAGNCPTQAEVLSANVAFGATSALNPANAADYVKGSTVIERDGEKIGLIGLTIAGKTKQSSSPDADTTFEDEATAAQREIDLLQAQGINKIIVQSHIGYEYDKEVIAKLRGVDVVVGGDSHTLLGPDTLATYGVGTRGGDYPTRLSDADGKPVCLVQAWEYGQIVGELTVSFDADGVVTDCAGTPHVLIGDDFMDASGAPLDEAARAKALADVAASGFLRVTSENASAAAVLAPYAQKLDVFKNTQVAVVTSDELCSRRVPGGQGSMDYSRSSAACNALGEVSRRGGDIQQIAAQAYLEVTQAHYGGADISLQSGGGARIPLLRGPLTASTAIEVLPFGNLLYKMEITGTEVKSMIEDGLSATFDNKSTGPYPYTGGLRFDVDASNAKGNRASNFEVRNATTGNWEVLDEQRNYTLAVLSFNAAGGDGYTTLANASDRVTDVGVLDSDVFFAYIESLSKSADGWPQLGKLADDLYSTKSFIGPNGN